MKQQAGGKLMHLITLQMIIFVIGRYYVIGASIRRCFKHLHKQAHSLQVCNQTKASNHKTSVGMTVWVVESQGRALT